MTTREATAMNDCPQELKGYLNADGLLTQLPNKRRKKLLALCWLADRLPAGQTFTEREFNALLNTLHTFGDPATIRREMYDYYLINRDSGGSNYRVNPERPSIEALLDKYC